MWQPELRPEGSLDLLRKVRVVYGGPSRQNNVCVLCRRELTVGRARESQCSHKRSMGHANANQTESAEEQQNEGKPLALADRGPLVLATPLSLSPSPITHNNPHHLMEGKTCLIS